MNNKKISSNDPLQTIGGHLQAALAEADKYALTIVGAKICEALDCLKLNSPPNGVDVDQTYD